MIDLSGTHILVAGGSRGIGAAAVRLAAQTGAAVSLIYRSNADAAEKLVAELAHTGHRAAAFRADISEESEVAAAVDAAVVELGPLGGLVVSAGIFEGLPIAEMTTEFWDRTMAINVRGTFLVVQAGARHMVEAGGGGSIVIYTSTAGQRGSAVYSAYATSKGAQIIFMRSMAKELAPHGIRVNCIAPAWTDTDMVAESLDVLGRQEVASEFPLGRIGLPADIAGATVFLLSDLASFMTGSTVTVDGGMDMRG